MTPERLAELREAAEEGAIWQDEWDNHTSDGSAWENFVQTFDPRTVLELLDAIDAGLRFQPSETLA